MDAGGRSFAARRIVRFDQRNEYPDVAPGLCVQAGRRGLASIKNVVAHDAHDYLVAKRTAYQNFHLPSVNHFQLGLPARQSHRKFGWSVSQGVAIANGRGKRSNVR